MIYAGDKRMVVKEIEVEEIKSPNGLILPTKKQQVLAKIVGVSHHSYIEDYENLTVVLHPDTGIEILIDGVKYLSIQEAQVLAMYE